MSGVSERAAADPFCRPGASMNTGTHLLIAPFRRALERGCQSRQLIVDEIRPLHVLSAGQMSNMAMFSSNNSA
jgi:hypothetical protein